MLTKAFKRAVSSACALSVAACCINGAYAEVTMLGDANGDSSFNSSDLATAQGVLLRAASIGSQYMENCDMNSDGIFNAVDLLIMRRTPYNEGVLTDNTVTEIQYAESNVTLYNASGNIVSAQNAANVSVENNTYVTVTAPSEIDVSGTCSAGQLAVDCDKTTYVDGLVTFNLKGLTLSNTSTSPIYIAAIDDEVVFASKKGYTNTITDGSSYTNASGDCGAIYACDDIKFKGKGVLNVNGNCEDGIVCKNDIKIWNGTINVTAADDGIRGKDSVRIGDPDATDYSSLNVTVNALGGDGIKSTDDSDTTCGFVRINGGNVNVNSYGDCIFGVYNVEINGGSLELVSETTYGTTSSKGIKSGYTDDDTSTTYTGAVTINGGYMNINTTDDCINSNGNIDLIGGQMELTINATSFSEDKDGRQAIHADDTINIGTSGNETVYDDVTVIVYNAYEGLEGYNINQMSGTVIVNSYDDGFNVAGGADDSGSSDFRPGMGGGFGGGFGSSSTAGDLVISGGFSLVNAQDGDHDGYDSNGNIIISGGIAVSNGNDPFDWGDSGTITYSGGVYVENTGSGGMGGGMGGFGGMGNNSSSMTQSVSVSTSLSAQTRITLCDGSGNVIVSFIADKSVTSLVAGCTAYSGAAFYSGGTLTNSTYFQTLDDTQLAAYGGTLSNGTKLG